MKKKKEKQTISNRLTKISAKPVGNMLSTCIYEVYKKTQTGNLSHIQSFVSFQK